MKKNEILLKRHFFLIKKMLLTLSIAIPVIGIILFPMTPNLIQLSNDIIRLKEVNSKIDVLNKKIENRNLLIEKNNRLFSIYIPSDENAKKLIEDDSSLLEKTKNQNCSIKSIGTTLIDNKHHPIIKVQKQIKIGGDWPACSKMLFDLSSKLMSYIKNFSILSFEKGNVEIVFALYYEGLLYETHNHNEPVTEEK